MHRRMLLGLVGSLTIVTAGIMVLAGCGGGGGPIIPPETGPGPSPSARFLELLPAAQQNATAVGSERCQPCHADYHTTWKDTTHATRNVGCESCHGNGSEHVAAPAKTNILTAPQVTRAIVCGQCHGPTFDQFERSRHAEAVEAVIEEGGTNPNTYVRTCFRCHSAAFRAKYVDNPMAKGETADQIDARIQALPVDTLQSYVHETHESAACATCHNPHKKTGILTQDTGNEAQLRRLTFNDSTDGIQENAPVKSYTTYNHTCASCHNARGGGGSDAKLRSSTSRPNMHDSNQHNMLLGIAGAETGAGPVVRHGSHTDVPDQCIHCHMPNRRHTYTVSFDTSCQPCHTASDASARHATARSETLNGLLALRTRMETWAQTTLGNARFWDYPANLTEEGLTAPNQADPPTGVIPIEIKRARHNYFFVLRDKSFGIHNLPYARYLLTVANQQLDTLGVPRSVPTKASRSDDILQLLQPDLLRAKAADVRAHDAI